jgi:sulfhydrogenase subunit beta (sulfur reductase)
VSESYYFLKEADAGTLFASARRDYDVVAKERDANGNLRYGRPETFDRVEFTEEQPRMSAKGIIYPQTETLVAYRREGHEYAGETPPPPAKPILFFGVNLCDAAAFAIVDKVFAWDYKDDPYLERRERSTFWVRACSRLQQDCFCDRLDFPTDSVDLVAYPTAGGLLVEARTAKGQDLVAKYSDVFGAAPANAAEQLQTLKSKEPLAKKNPLLETTRPALAGAFEHADWKALVSTCIGCGTCTYLCPTCHCFDIQDEGGTSSGRRLRIWDHCTGRTFTEMPAHQPRDRQYKRYRQRLLHKFSYYPERFGPVLCTGCGRCTTFCPVKINIKELVEYFGGLKANAPGGARRK